MNFELQTTNSCVKPELQRKPALLPLSEFQRLSDTRGKDCRTNPSLGGTKICRITFFSFFSLNVFTIKFFFSPPVENLWTTRTTPVVCDVCKGLKDGFAWGHYGCCNCWLMLLMILAGWEANRAAYLQAPQPPKMQYWYKQLHQHCSLSICHLHGPQNLCVELQKWISWTQALTTRKLISCGLIW